METFRQGTALHFLCLAVCLAATLTTAVAARRFRSEPGRARGLRRFLVVGCLVSWLASNGYGLLPPRFSWSDSLPLHFCHLANLLGAWAIATRNRTAQGLMYFWTFALCLWAFITPLLYVGPTSLWFWLFWIYHLFIPVATAWILVADRFRPTWGDWRRSVVATLAYMALLAVLDALTGWNYGFVGPSTPSQASLLDFLGPYPQRLLWMALVGTSLFALLMLPWRRRAASP